MTQTDQTEVLARVVERQSPACRGRGHQAGARVFLWEILPQPLRRPQMAAGIEAIEWF